MCPDARRPRRPGRGPSRRRPGSPSVSARCRSRIASAVRWPNSASKTAARASRRPARSADPVRPVPGRAATAPPGRRSSSAPTPSTITVTYASLEIEQALDGARDRGADLPGRAARGHGPAGRRCQTRTRTPSRRALDPTIDRPGAGRPPGGAAARPTRATPGISSAARRIISSMTRRGRRSARGRSSRASARRRSRPAASARAVAGTLPGDRRGRRRAAKASAISSGHPRVRAMRRRDARPRVADHPPLRPAVGDDHRALDAEERRAAELLVVEDLPDPADARAACSR